MFEKSGLYSHPEVFLEDHINGVIKIAKHILGGEIPEWFYVPLAFHDFGKATRYFQDYIMGKNRSNLTNHSYLSAFYCFILAEELGFYDRLLESFIFPLKHHTDLRNLKETFNYLLENKNRNKNILKQQIDNLEMEKFKKFVENIEIPENIKAKAVEVSESIRRDSGKIIDIDKIITNIINKINFEVRKKGKGFEYFYEFNFYFSVLLDADKTQAGSGSDHIPHLPDFQSIEERVKVYKSELSKDHGNLLERRNEAYVEALKNLENGKNSGIFALVLPTGMGKTLTGLSVALKLAKESNQRRIIYALPFLSIIDQTEMVLRNNLKLTNSKELLVYHHLSDPVYSKEDDEYDFEVGRAFYEGWNSRLILTTFYQLFYTLLGTENGYLRRFNKLKDSVIILDEVHALPTKYWYFFRESLNHISQNINAKILLMTATNPFIYAKDGGAFELVEKNKYREGLNRYRVIFDIKSDRKIDEFVDEVAERINKEKDKSFLIILNTVRSSQDFYKKLKERFDEPMTYLSTAVVPYERKERINKIKEGKYRVVVSTQVVEAGVDIDFDIVYRDFAPLDSLNQSAGRCNRNGTKGKGEVVVVSLRDEKNLPFANQIYDNVLLKKTEKVLGNKTEVEEWEFLGIIDQYYNEVWNSISNDKSKELLKSIEKLDYTKLAEFKLIEKEPYKDQVFVILNEEAKNILEQVKDIIQRVKSRDVGIWEARKELEKIKAKFYSYVINVSLGDMRNSTPIDKDLKIYVIDTYFYDSEVGFYLRDKDTGIIW